MHTRLNNKVVIVAIEYLEPSYRETMSCLQKTVMENPYPCLIIDRGGVGSLAEAINRGFRTAMFYAPKFVWFVTNVTFSPFAVDVLLDGIERHNLAAIHPCLLDSDHLHERPNGTKNVEEVPFIEFTAAMVRASVFKDNPLDENMPYWGHDLDWGHQITQQGLKIGVHHGIMVQHTYIRNSNLEDPITARRWMNRRRSNGATQARLKEKYGEDWRKVVWPQSL